jgi:hypothetical protein
MPQRRIAAASRSRAGLLGSIHPRLFLLVLLHVCASIAIVPAVARAQAAPAARSARVPGPAAHGGDATAFRPPAVPLIAHDPYFSIWSTNDRLTDGPTRHWTGRAQPLTSLIRIDGRPFRIMGQVPADVPVMRQRSVTVLPLRSIFEFEAGGIGLTLTFLSPTIPSDLELVSRPVSYVTWQVHAIDGRAHDVAVYFDASAQIAVNSPEQKVTWSRSTAGDLSILRAGTVDQNVLAKTGDNLRIDWGYLYLAVPADQQSHQAIGADIALRAAFVTDGSLPAQDDTRMPRAADADAPVLGATLAFGRVQQTPVSRHVLVAYDDEWAIEYFEQRARAWWKRDGKSAEALLHDAAGDYTRLVAASTRFDDGLMRDLRATGGDAYARLAALAFRQALAAHKLVAHPRSGVPLYFSKENFSNGCIDTVDVTYPSSPFFLLFNPQLLEAQLRPVLEYASMTARWHFPFAPHDLGQYPKANGQVYGGKEKSEENQMPVEESGNMLLMLGALAQLHGRTDLAREYWPVLTQWARYLEDKGFDPENQLSTDDFAGHLARNANLSIKAILSLAATGAMARSLGHADEADRLTTTARAMAGKWIDAAQEGDHFKLAFDQAGTWSQKYNLVWDRLLDLKVFPARVATQEMAHYRTRQHAFGLPLDNRADYTKADWIVWTATLADTRADFDALIAPVYSFLQTTPDRVPFTDWYYTTTGQQRGFQARSVIGGVFIPLLKDRAVIHTWSTFKP